MKILLIFPPLWDINLAPMLSLPTLAGVIKNHGSDVKIMDLNSDFMNYISTEGFIEQIKKCCDVCEAELRKSTSRLEKILLETRIHELKKVLLPNIEKSKVATYIPQFKKAFLENDFKTAEEYLENYRMYANYIFDLHTYNKMQDFKLEYDLLYEFLRDIIDKIKSYAPDLIAFSIYAPKQYDWFKNFMLYLTAIEPNLKASCKFACGGYEVIARINYKEECSFLSKYIDFVMDGYGENIYKSLCEGKSYKDISGIIYFDETGMHKNEASCSEKLQFIRPDYSAIDLDKYFAPITVVPIESSRGCYWGKCKFCTIPYHVNYKPKNIDDLIEEIKYYVNELHVNHFFFTDAAITPKYVEEFSKRIIEENLKIYYISFFRLEKAYIKKLLNLMYKAGLRVAMWGVESGSQEILDLYNKGTDVKINKRVLKASHEAGIFNICSFIYSYVWETEKNFNKTMDFLTNNFEYIDKIQISKLGLSKLSILYKEKENFELTEDDFKRDFYSHSQDWNDKPKVKEKLKYIKNLYSSNNSSKSSYYNHYTLALLQVSS